MKLLSYANPKIEKNLKVGHLTAILNLLPHKMGGPNLCPFASPGCVVACLNTAGRSHMPSVQDARARKTKIFHDDREDFMRILAKEIRAHVRKAKKNGLIPSIRLNGTTDIKWESVYFNTGWEVIPNIFDLNPDVIFYDYTAWPYNRRPPESLPHNYTLVFSRKETNHDEAINNLTQGRNVTVVFSTKKGNPLPTKWEGFDVIEGDEHDARMLDKSPNGGAVVVGLRAKGQAIKDESGFVVNDRKGE